MTKIAITKEAYSLWMPSLNILNLVQVALSYQIVLIS